MKKAKKKKVVRVRRQCSYTLAEDTAEWVEQVAKKMHLPVSRVVELCIEGERLSIAGNVARGLVGMYLAKSEKGGMPEGAFNEA